MKLFAINETEWIAAHNEDEAIAFAGLERSEVESIEEIPESQWNEEIEGYDPNDMDKTITKTIRELMNIAIESGEPMTIMTEDI